VRQREIRRGDVMGLVNTRRGFLSLLGGLVAAPAIVRFASMMPVRSWPAELPVFPVNATLLDEDVFKAMLAAAQPQCYDAQHGWRSAQAGIGAVPARAFSGLV
jgi:hypothetical protein